MLKVIVTLKQAPRSNQVQMTPDTKIVVRDPDEAMLTFDDCNALELALQMKDVMGDGIHITTLSMGNDKTEEILRESLALGVDRAVLFNDEDVRGSDTPATAYTLAAAIRSLGDFDVVLTGHASMDGRTGHVGAMLAEYLGLPYLTNVCEFSKDENGILSVKKDLGQVIQTVEMKAPAVLSNLKHKYSLRVMSIAGIRAAMKMNIERITLDDLTLDRSRTGLDAAKVKVAQIQPSRKKRLQIQMFFDQYQQGDFDQILNEIQKIK
ncbi:MAG: electron transfer flavoprotein subunit beta/FixA family protein [Anaerovoracaceae bacterium]